MIDIYNGVIYKKKLIMEYETDLNLKPVICYLF